MTTWLLSALAVAACAGIWWPGLPVLDRLLMDTLRGKP